MTYLGDFKEDGDIFHKFTTRAFATGIPTQLAGSPVLSVYADEGTGTIKTTAETYFDLDVDFNSKTGLNNVRIDLNGDAFFATGADYAVVITTGTVDSVSVVGETICTFSIENRSMGQPAGATLAADIVAIKTEVDKIGTIPALDGAAQTIGAAVGKLADNNAGADFVASTDSLQKIRDDRTLAAADYTIVADLGTVQGADNNTILSSLNIANGAVESDLTYIHGSALTETAGQLAARFKDFFDQGSSTFNISTALSSFKATGFSTSGAMTTAQNDLDKITGASGVVIQDGTIKNASFNSDVGSTAHGTNIIALACRKILEELNLDHLLKVDTTVAADGDLEAYCVAGTVMAHLLSTSADATLYKASTDSMQGIRDSGGGDATEAKQDSIIAAVITNAAGTDIAADIIAVKAETATIVTDTNELQSDNIPGTLSTIEGKVDTVDTNVDSILVDTGTTLDGKIDALNDVSTSDINAQVLDVLVTDTFAEPGTGAPPATASIEEKISWIYTYWRNKIIQTSTLLSLKADDGSADICKSTISDNGTTFTKGEMETG